MYTSTVGRCFSYRSSPFLVPFEDGGSCSFLPHPGSRGGGGGLPLSLLATLVLVASAERERERESGRRKEQGKRGKDKSRKEE